MPKYFVFFDFLLLTRPYFVVSLIFWVFQPITLWKKPFVIIASTLISAFLGYLLVISTMYLPGSKNRTYVEAAICSPAVTKHYGVKNISDLPLSSPANDLGQNFYRWYAQIAECMDNYYSGKGPVFSENPLGFLPVVSRSRTTLTEKELNNIQSFESCKTVNFRVTDRRPRSCLTPDGRVFREKPTQEELRSDKVPDILKADESKSIGIIKRIDYKRDSAYSAIPIEIEVDVSDNLTITYYLPRPTQAHCDRSILLDVKNREFKKGDLIEIHGKAAVVDRPKSDYDIDPYLVCDEGTFIKKIDLSAF